MKQATSSLVLAALALAPAAHAVTAVVTADAHVLPANPTLNVGASPLLAIGGGSSAFLQFDLSNIPAGINPNAISKAQLLVFVSRVAQAGQVEVRPLLSPWTESTLTFNTLPTTGGAIASSAHIATANTWVAIDITGQVRSWAASPFTAFGLSILSNPSSPGIIQIDSKESTATSQPARLEITIDGPPGPQGTPGPTGAIGPRGATGPVGPVGLTGPSSLFGLTTRAVSTTDLAGNNQGLRFVSCPSSFPIAIAGGCGHRDFNIAADDIIVNFTGPENGNTNRWRCILKNTSPETRAVQAWAICSK